jgi:hypothetical protein
MALGASVKHSLFHDCFAVAMLAPQSSKECSDCFKHCASPLFLSIRYAAQA